MKKILICIPILLTLALWPMRIYSQVSTLPPYPVKNLIYPTVIANVSKEQSDYIYVYSLTNGPSASQNIWRFMVEVNALITGTMTTRNWDLSGFDYDTIKGVVWASYNSSGDIRPNDSARGFGIKSVGLPKIQRYWVRAYERIHSEEGQYDPASASIFVTHLCRTTISPADPPSPFIPLNFLDTLISYTAQSRSLGWIKDQGTANSTSATLVLRKPACYKII